MLSPIVHAAAKIANVRDYLQDGLTDGLATIVAAAPPSRFPP